MKAALLMFVIGFVWQFVLSYQVRYIVLSRRVLVVFAWTTFASVLWGAVVLKLSQLDTVLALMAYSVGTGLGSVLARPRNIEEPGLTPKQADQVREIIGSQERLRALEEKKPKDTRLEVLLEGPLTEKEQKALKDFYAFLPKGTVN